MTYPNQRIPELVAALEGHDQVVGARLSEEGTVKFLRVPAKWTIRKIAEFLADEKIPDLNSGMRAMRRDVLLQFLHLMPNGFSHVTTVTMAFLANNYSVGYLPVEYAERSGRSKFHWFADTQRYVTQVTRMIMLYQPLRIFLPAALVLLAVGVGKLIYDVVAKDFAVAINTVVLLASAVSLFIIGLLADLIVQVSKSDQHVDPVAFAVHEPDVRRHGPGRNAARSAPASPHRSPPTPACDSMRSPAASTRSAPPAPSSRWGAVRGRRRPCSPVGSTTSATSPIPRRTRRHGAASSRSEPGPCSTGCCRPNRTVLRRGGSVRGARAHRGRPAAAARLGALAPPAGAPRRSASPPIRTGSHRRTWSSATSGATAGSR